MKRRVGMIIIWLSVAGVGAWADPLRPWHPGELTLRNGSQLVGDISFNWIAQVVQCRQGDRIKAYSAYQIRTFVLIDDRLQTIRTFTAVSCPTKSGLHRPRILEQVLMGALRVYRELRPIPGIVKVATLSGYNSDELFSKDLKNFHYLVFSENEMIPMEKFHRRIWPRLRNAIRSDVKPSAAYSRAETTGVAAQLRLIRKYNTLTEKAHSDTPKPTGSTGR